jgi:carboxymethylenebutenolidase
VGSYPENDFTARSGRSLEAVLSRERIDHDIKVYPGAGHSFFNDQGRAYDQEAADDSWQRVLKFFGSHLQTKK